MVRSGCGIVSGSMKPTAMTAVPISTASTPCIGSISISRAPSGGDVILTTPWSIWFRPAARVRCFSGTMVATEASIAGKWKVCPMERKTIAT